jgi:cell division protein FtsL
MKTDAIKEVLELANYPISSKERADLVQRAKAELAALTPPTPEDVARWHDKAQYAFKKTWEDGTEATSESFITEHAESLDALRDGAARVPGLEARIAELETESGAVACDGSSNGGEMCGACVGCVGLMRSERDASRKEAESLRRQVADLATLEPVVSDAIRALALPTSILPVQLPEAVRLLQQHAASQNERVATLEGERDALRVRVAELGRERDEKLTLQAAQRDSALRDVASLRERVSTLEREAIDNARAAVANGDERDAALDRVEAAERRVAELEGLTRAVYAKLEDARGVIRHNATEVNATFPAAVMDDDWGVATPTPAPAGDDDLMRRIREQRAGDPVIAFTFEAQPTAPAGLLEAAGPRITATERLVDVARRLAGGANTRIAWDDLDAALAAYDAAKGGEDTCPNCALEHEDAAKYRAAVERAKDGDALARCWNDHSGTVGGAACRDALLGVARHVLGLDTPPSDREARHPEPGRIHREMLGREVRAEWVAWAKEQPSPKASWLVPWEGLSEPDKEVDRRIGVRLYNIGRNGWNDPTPPSGPGGGRTVAGVIDQGGTPPSNGDHPPEPSALIPESLAAVVEEYAQECEGVAPNRAEGAREVLRRALSGQVPEVVLKSRVVEVLRGLLSREESAARRAASGGKVAERDAHTLCTRVVWDAARDLGLTLPAPDMATATHHGGPQVQARERRPEPTPTGPAQEPRCALPHSLPCLVHVAVLDGSLNPCASCAPHVHDAQPEPAAPEPVWEGAGVTVNADGSYSQRSGHHPHEVVDAIARALAEAKRENARLRAEMEVPPGFRIWDRSNDALQREARKSAEAMRERAAQRLDLMAAQSEGHSPISASAFSCAADDIRALPLE